VQIPIRHVIAMLGFTGSGGLLGFACVTFLAERLLPPAQGPTPYGDWRPFGTGVILGTPIGAAVGFGFGFFVTRITKNESRNSSRWHALTWLGALSGIAAGCLFAGTGLFELFEDIGKLIWSVWLGWFLYFALFCAGGVAAFELGVATVRLTRR